MTYLELIHATGLRSSIERHVGLRACGYGWTDDQIVISLMLLNLAGGESVVDLDVLDKDAGLCSSCIRPRYWSYDQSQHRPRRVRCHRSKLT